MRDRYRFPACKYCGRYSNAPHSSHAREYNRGHVPGGLTLRDHRLGRSLLKGPGRIEPIRPNEHWRYNDPCITTKKYAPYRWYGGGFPSWWYEESIGPVHRRHDHGGYWIEGEVPDGSLRYGPNGAWYYMPLWERLKRIND